MPTDNEVLDRPLQGCENLEQEPEWEKSKTVHLLRGDRRSTQLQRWHMTFPHIAHAGTSSGVDAVVKAHNEEEIAEDEDSKKEKRTQRKMSRKREREEVKNDEEKEMFKAGMEEQCKDMSSFMANLNRVQEQ